MIISWNINSIIVRKKHVEAIIKKFSPQVFLLQELKSRINLFPKDIATNYYKVLHTTKSYNGVAILSKNPITDIQTEIIPLEYPEARYIEGKTFIKNLECIVISVYVPNGYKIGTKYYKYKITFLEKLYSRLKHLKQLNKNIIIGGDFNISLFKEDIYDQNQFIDSLYYSKDEKKIFRSIINIGFNDSYRIHNNHHKQFTWWSYKGNAWNYNKGLRIDYILITGRLVDKVKNATIYIETRKWERPSDHVPIMIDF